MIDPRHQTSKTNQAIALMAAFNAVMKMTKQSSVDDLMGYIKEITGEDELLINLASFLFYDIVSHAQK